MLFSFERLRMPLFFLLSTFLVSMPLWAMEESKEGDGAAAPSRAGLTRSQQAVVDHIIETLGENATNDQDWRFDESDIKALVILDTRSKTLALLDLLWPYITSQQSALQEDTTLSYISRFKLASLVRTIIERDIDFLHFSYAFSSNFLWDLPQNVIEIMRREPLSLLQTSLFIQLLRSAFAGVESSDAIYPESLKRFCEDLNSGFPPEYEALIPDLCLFATLFVPRADIELPEALVERMQKMESDPAAKQGVQRLTLYLELGKCDAKRVRKVQSPEDRAFVRKRAFCILFNSGETAQRKKGALAHLHRCPVQYVATDVKALAVQEFGTDNFVNLMLLVDDENKEVAQKALDFWRKHLRGLFLCQDSGINALLREVMARAVKRTVLGGPLSRLFSYVFCHEHCGFVWDDHAHYAPDMMSVDCVDACKRREDTELFPFPIKALEYMWRSGVRTYSLVRKMTIPGVGTEEQKLDFLWHLYSGMKKNFSSELVTNIGCCVRGLAMGDAPWLRALLSGKGPPGGCMRLFDFAAQRYREADRVDIKKLWRGLILQILLAQATVRRDGRRSLCFSANSLYTALCLAREEQSIEWYFEIIHTLYHRTSRDEFVAQVDERVILFLLDDSVKHAGDDGLSLQMQRLIMGLLSRLVQVDAGGMLTSEVLSEAVWNKLAELAAGENIPNRILQILHRKCRAGRFADFSSVTTATIRTMIAHLCEPIETVNTIPFMLYDVMSHAPLAALEGLGAEDLNAMGDFMVRRFAHRLGTYEASWERRRNLYGAILRWGERVDDGANRLSTRLCQQLSEVSYGLTIQKGCRSTKYN